MLTNNVCLKVCSIILFVIFTTVQAYVYKWHHSDISINIQIHDTLSIYVGQINNYTVDKKISPYLLFTLRVLLHNGSFVIDPEICVFPGNVG